MIAGITKTANVISVKYICNIKITVGVGVFKYKH